MNRANRYSDFITAPQATNLATAIEFAVATGRPLTRHITVHLDQARIAGRPQKFITKFAALIGDWLRSRGVALAYVWVLENPPEGGLNWHFLLHVPPDLRSAIAPKFRDWLRLAGAKWRPGVIKSQEITGSQDQAAPAEYLFNLCRLALYLLKGTEPHVLAELTRGAPCRREHEPQGRVRGKRVGTSESLSVKARMRGAISDQPTRAIIS